MLRCGMLGFGKTLRNGSGTPRPLLRLGPLRSEWMISLVFVTCLISSPIDCVKRELPIYENISPMACLMGAQAELARWRAEHTDSRIVEWRCVRERIASNGK